MSRRALWIAGLGAALGGPYLAMDGNLPTWLSQQRSGLFASTSSGGSEEQWVNFSTTAYSDTDPNQTANQTPITTLDQVLRFDITPRDIVGRWPNVATVVSEQNLSGMRVPLITGYQPQDLVGSLTYYFDQHQHLRRIGIEGYTGDEHPMVAIVGERFNMQPEPRLGAGLFTYRWNGQALSVLSVEYSPLVSSDAPQMRRRLILEINAPVAGCQLSSELQRLVNPTGNF